ncbi:MAG: VWA domain-containing protein [bacterium]|nr:VWA domain-containing protein [bacterium]
MASWELRDPLFLLAVVLAPLVYVLAAGVNSSVTYSSLEIADRSPISWRARLSFTPALLLSLSALLLAIALAGPRTGDATTTVHREGIAIALVVDQSGSMEARDFVEGDLSLSRLDVVKNIVREFVAGGEDLLGRADDLLGLVAFARYADALCPLTLDHLNLLAILDELDIARARGDDGTAVGEGLALAVERLRRLEDVPSKLIILLTDGVNNSGAIEPLQAAQLAAAHDIRVYAIGAGRTGRAPVPVQGPDGRVHLQRMYVELDEKTLKAIAEKTGGRYFHADSAEALQQVYQEIDQLERSEISEVRYLQYTEYYGAFTLAGLIFLALSGLSGGTVFRRLP